MKDDRLYLIHIFDAIVKIQTYTVHGREAFLASPIAQDAVVRNYEIIGEAAKNLSSGFREKHPEFLGRISLACGMSSFIATLKSTLNAYGRSPSRNCPNSEKRSARSWLRSRQSRNQGYKIGGSMSGLARIVFDRSALGLVDW